MKKTEEIFYSIKYYYMDMPAVTVSTRKSAKVKQSRYTPISDLQLPALTRTIIGWAKCRIGLSCRPIRHGLDSILDQFDHSRSKTYKESRHR